MAHIQFGNTWWGSKWLDALSGTDHANRLPRGKTYARNGSVQSISVSGRDVSAKVKGSRPRPYNVRISLPKFSAGQKRTVVEAIVENPFFLAQLLNRRLPSGLFDVFQQAGVPLFPKTWDDLTANCSCPDWALCCKHIAAIIFLIANEVDKNPFLLFELHDFDVFDGLKKKGFSAKDHSAVAIASPESLTLKTPADQLPLLADNERNVLFDSLDFSQIRPLRNELLSLLDDKPLFYLKKDFKQLLDGALTTFSRLAGRELRLLKMLSDDGKADNPPTIFTDADITMSPDLDIVRLSLASAGEAISSDAPNGFTQVLHRLFAVPSKQYHSHHQRVVVLSLLAHFALKLVEQSAILPEILTAGKGHRIRWIPALVDAKVRGIFDAVCRLSADNLVGKPFLTREEQVKSVLSGIIGEIIHRYDKERSGVPDDDIAKMFFGGLTLRSSTAFGAAELPENIALWLRNFQIARKDVVPVVKVDETKGGFALEILVEDRSKPLREPVPFKTILSKKIHAAVKFDVLKDVTRLADHLPELAEFVASKGRKRPVFSPATFEQVFFGCLPTLRMLGIPVLLPKGLDQLIRPRIGAKVSSSNAQSTKGYLSFAQVLEFDWQVAIGDQVLSAEALSKLVRDHRGIVKLKEQFVFLDGNEIEKILKVLDAKPRLAPEDAMKSVLVGEYDGGKLHLDDDVKKMVARMRTLDPLPAPKSLNGDLRDYQRRGFEWLVRNAELGFGSLLADDMGLGKTVQILALLLHLHGGGRLEENPALVVVPTSLLTNWRRETEKFAPDLVVHTYHGSDRKFVATGAHVVLATYGLVRRDLAKFAKSRWAAVIIDEAQAIKNAGTAQAKAVGKIKADLRIAMTGTPVENRLSEYWSIFDFLNKGYLKGSKAFREEFAIPIEVERDHGKLKRFRAITAPFVLRRLKSDKSIIQDLPDKLEIDQFCQLAETQAALYQTTLNQIMQDVEESEGIERRGLVLKLITALKQVCNHPAHFLKKKQADVQASGKTALLMELLRTIYDNEEKVLIFTQYTKMGELLRDVIAAEFAVEPIFLHGGLSRKKRDQIVDDFQTNAHVKTMLLSLKAGGTGLNLTAAQNVIHFDLWWNPAVEAQATDRAYRIGQTRNVMVHRLISRGTFEEKINDMLKDKRELAELTVTAGEKWIGEYSNADLREIFALG